MLLTPLLLLTSLITVANGLSAPECADGSISVCTCGDGNPPDFSTFPPCDIKKVFNQAFFYLPFDPTFSGQTEVRVSRRRRACLKIPQTKTQEAVQPWKVDLLFYIKQLT